MSFCATCGAQLTGGTEICAHCASAAEKPVAQAPKIKRQPRPPNFDILSSKTVPFSVTENQLREGFLDWIIQGNDTPLDVAYGAAIMRITKHFYPIRCFDITYSVDWTATSFWEHEEEYTEYESKTVYFDREGKEHKEPGFDYTDAQGRPTVSIDSKGTRHPYRVQPKMVPVTKTRTIVDNVEQTQGGLDSETSFQRIITYDDATGEDFAQWIVDFSLESQTKSTDDLFADSVVMPLVQTEAFAWNEAKSKVADIARGQCENQIPGNRYEDFQLFNFATRYDMQIVLMPFYEISYRYQNQDYVCWLSGIAEDDFVYCDKPEDDKIKQENHRAQDEIAQHKKERLKFGLIAFLAIPAVFIFFGLTFLIVNWIVGLLILLASGALEVLYYRKFSTHHQQVKELEQKHGSVLAQLAERRRAVAAIVRNTRLSDDEKRTSVQKILNKM